MRKIYITAFFILCFFTIWGQDIPRKNGEEGKHVRALIEELKRNRFTDKALPLCDSIIYLGEKYNMVNSVVCGYTAKTQYLWQTLDEKDESILKKWVRMTMDYSLQHKSMDGYFRGWNSLIFFYIEHEMYAKALIEIENFRREAVKRSQPLFVVWSYRSLANLYYTQNRDNLAIKAYIQASEMAENLRDYFVGSYCYGMAASAYMRNSDYVNAIQMLKKANQMIDKEPVQRMESKAVNYADMGICYYYLKQYDKMRHMCDLMKTFSWNDSKFDTNSYYELKSYCLLAVNKNEEALRTSDSINYIEDRSKIKEIAYVNLGQYKAAAETLKKLLKNNESIFTRGKNSHKKLAETLIDLNRISRESHFLDHRNGHLKLEEELAKKARFRNMLEKINISRSYEIRFSQERMREVQQDVQFESEKHAAVVKELNNQKKLRNVRRLRTITIGLLACIILIGLLLHLLRRRAYIRRLRLEEENTERLKKEAQELRKEAEEARQEAEAADRAKTQFIQSVSYEVRTPLNVIVGFSNLLTNESGQYSEDEKLYFTKLIGENSNRLSSLVNGILDLANLSTGKYKMQYNATTLSELCGIAYKSELPNVASDVEMKTEISPNDKDVVLYTDIHRTSQVLKNLINNACRFTKKGRIVLKAKFCNEENKRNIFFSVTDTGIGIPSNKIDNIFDRFVKLDDFSSGNGLGLTISRIIAERMDGRCWVDKNYDNGSRFIFEIPLFTQMPLKEEEVG